MSGPDHTYTAATQDAIEETNGVHKITDLEQFALSEIWRPYWNLSEYQAQEGRPEKLPVDLNETAQKLAKGGAWAELVLVRLRHLKFTFPDYIVHPLVGVVMDNQRLADKEPRP